MNISFEQFEAYIEHQEKQFEKSQTRIIEIVQMCLSQQNPSFGEFGTYKVKPHKVNAMTAVSHHSHAGCGG